MNPFLDRPAHAGHARRRGQGAADAGKGAIGRHRARIEKHLLLMPEFVTCSMQQFAGLPVDNLGFARAAAGTAMRVLRSKLPWSRSV